MTARPLVTEAHLTIELDRRTRRQADIRDIAPAEFFDTDFARLAARNGTLVAQGMAAYGAPPLTIEVQGAAWTIERSGEGIVARPGSADPALRLRLSDKQFSDWAQNLMSLHGFLTARSLDLAPGDVWALSVWDALSHALLCGWPCTDPGLGFVDRHGRPLDLAQSFAPAADPAVINHFLRETGYVLLKGWLDPAALAAISAEMDQALPHYREGDGKSWWGQLADGKRVCVRMQEFVDHSPTTARLLSSPIWERVRVAGAGAAPYLRPPVSGRIIEALIKPVGVIAGPSDLSFHRDCHLGRHSYDCAGITAGIALTATGADNGCLQVIAGSHRVAVPVEAAKVASILPIVDVHTQPGDITLHLSCVLHGSTPPLIAERRVMYTGFSLPHLAEGNLARGDDVGKLRESISEIHREEVTRT